jgi:hypothetical protein
MDEAAQDIDRFFKEIIELSLCSNVVPIDDEDVLFRCDHILNIDF